MDDLTKAERALVDAVLDARHLAYPQTSEDYQSALRRVAAERLMQTHPDWEAELRRLHEEYVAAFRRFVTYAEEIGIGHDWRLRYPKLPDDLETLLARQVLDHA